MHKLTVAQAVANALPKHERGLAPHMTELVMSAIVHLCETQGKATIPGFGVFEMKVQPPRQIRNPLTGERLSRGETRRIRFRPARGFLTKLNGEKSPETRAAEAKEPAVAEPA